MSRATTVYSYSELPPGPATADLVSARPHGSLGVTASPVGVPILLVAPQPWMVTPSFSRNALADATTICGLPFTQLTATLGPPFTAARAPKHETSAHGIGPQKRLFPVQELST